MTIVPLYDWAMSVKGTTAVADIAEFGTRAQDIIDEYLAGVSPAISAKNAFVRLVDDTMTELAEQAWADGGRDMDDLPVDALMQVLSAQRDFARAAFDKLVAQVAELPAGSAYMSEIGIGLGDRWAAGAWGVYNEFKMRAKTNTKALYFWTLGATEKHCGTCLELAGGRGHTMDWYLARDYIPGKNGCSLECGGWQCDCTLTDAAGHDWTLSA